MKALLVLLLACSAGFSQTAQLPPAAVLPNVPDDQVIATFVDDGVSITAGEFRRIVAVLPPDSQPLAIKDPQTFLKQWALMRKLTQLAEKGKLDEQSPTREKALYYRMMTLMESQLMFVDGHINIPEADARRDYEAHREKYREVKVKAIYLGFSADGAASSSTKRTEEQAKALAARIEGELKGGADFVKLVEQYSEEPVSKAKGGDFGVFHGSDNVPEATRVAVMGLKAGDVSQPILQPNGIYIVRAETVSIKTFEEVSAEIYSNLHKQRYQEWMEKTNREAGVEFKSPSIFGAGHEDPKPSGQR